MMEGADEWAKLHKWHEKLVAKAGLVSVTPLRVWRVEAAASHHPGGGSRAVASVGCTPSQGCIVRALTDRKTVMKLASGTAGAATYSDATR